MLRYSSALMKIAFERRQVLTWLLRVHTVVTAAAGIVLFVWPATIPGTIGIALAPQAYLLAYLLAGAELGMATLSWLAAQRRDAAVREVAVWTALVFHGMTAAGEVIALAQGTDRLLWLNVALRLLVMSALYLVRPARAEG